MAGKVQTCSTLSRTTQISATQFHPAQIITLDIGGNDLLHAVNLFGTGRCGGADNQDCLRSAVSTFAANWDAIVAEILSLRDPSKTIIRTMDIYNPFVAEEMVSGTFGTLKTYLDQVDAHIAASSTANGIPMASRLPRL